MARVALLRVLMGLSEFGLGARTSLTSSTEGPWETAAHPVYGQLLVWRIEQFSIIADGY